MWLYKSLCKYNPGAGDRDSLWKDKNVPWKKKRGGEEICHCDSQGKMPVLPKLLSWTQPFIPSRAIPLTEHTISRATDGSFNASRQTQKYMALIKSKLDNEN